MHKKESKKEGFRNKLKDEEKLESGFLFQLPSGMFKGRSEAFFQGGMVERFIQYLIQG